MSSPLVLQVRRSPIATALGVTTSNPTIHRVSEAAIAIVRHVHRGHRIARSDRATRP